MNVENNTSLMMDIVTKEIKDLVENLVIKLDYLADKNETLEERRAADEYVYLVTGNDNFSTYQIYSEYALIKAGLDPDLIKWFQHDKLNIPIDKRDEVLKYQREYILQNYVEKNNYYRTYAGLPDLNDYDYVYINKPIDGIDISKPVHKMNKSELAILETTGELRELINRYPEKRYLKHLTEANIPIHVSRNARNFSIMYISKSRYNPGMDSAFSTLYAESLNYTLNTVYDRAFKLNSEYYEAFIGMFAITITLQKFIVNYYNNFIRRDFFDKDLVRYLFQSYGLPFYNEISLAYLKKVAKNLNILLHFKATDKVFVDIFELFGLDNVEIYSYYLVKDRKTNGLGEPIFKYTENEYGETVEDVEAMYDLRFVQVSKDSTNIGLDLIERGNYLDYDMITHDDVLWGDDGDKEAFMRDVLSAEFNYVQTKYIAVVSKYELTKLNFELCYLFRQFIDLKDNERFLDMQLPYLSGKTNLFDVIVALFAIACKKMGFDGNIMDTTTKTMSVYGFNFNVDMPYINSIINDVKMKRKDPTFEKEKLFLEMPPEIFKTPLEETNLFLQNKKVHDLLIKKRYESKTLMEYNTYKRIYDASMLTKYTTHMYTINGKLPKTYLDYIKQKNTELYNFVQATNDENMVDQLDAILVTLENYFKTDEFKNIFLNIPSLSVDQIKKFVYYLINIFKSYKVDLASMNIMYHVDNKYMHNIKLVLEEWFTKFDEEHDYFKYRDKLIYVLCKFQRSTKLGLIEDPYFLKTFERFEKLNLTDEMLMSKWYEFKISILSDFIDILEESISLELNLKDFNIRDDVVYQTILPKLERMVLFNDNSDKCFNFQMFFYFMTKITMKCEYGRISNLPLLDKILVNIKDNLIKDKIITDKTYIRMKGILKTGLENITNEESLPTEYIDILSNETKIMQQINKIDLKERVYFIRK